MKRGIWQENEIIIGQNTPFWYWFVWGFLVVPVGLYLDLLCHLRLIGGSFITPIRLKNVKKIHEDGSRSIRFYDRHTIII